MRYFCNIGAAVAVLTGIGLGNCRLCLGNEEEAAKAAQASVSGTVVDPDGQPAVGAKVWLLATAAMDITIKTVAQITADEKGNFQFARIEKDDLTTDRQSLVLVARDARNRIGGAFFGQGLPEGSARKDLKIRLVNVKDYSGRLTDAAGRPIGKASVRPMQWMSGGSPRNYLLMPDELQKELAAETADDGSFSLRNMPEDGHLVAQVKTVKHGNPLARWSLKKPVTLSLTASGGIRGSMADVKDPGVLSEITIFCFGSMERGSDSGGDVSIYCLEKGTVEKDGAFRFENLPPGQYRLMPQFPEKIAYYAEAGGTIEVKSGETAEATLTVKPALKVQGRVVDRKTGKGVPGARVRLMFPQAGIIREATTDAAGAFTLHAPPGQARVDFPNLPEPYVESADFNRKRNVQISENVTLPPFQLDRKINVSGLVVDASGKPVAGAQIFTTDFNPQSDAPEFLRSDAAGKFTLSNRNPREDVTLLARSEKLAAEPVRVTPVMQKGPVRLVLSEKTTFTLRGTAVDDDGRPLAEAEISLGMPRYLYYSYQMQKIGKIKPDAEGRFTVGGLWPKKTYHLLFKAAGHESAGENVHETAAKAGTVHDFGKIVLRDSQGMVAGRVVDAKGKPVAGARVFNLGDGAAPMETRSDDAGRFRLSGFFKGPVYVFAEKEGYQFAGALAQCGAKKNAPLPSGEGQGVRANSRKDCPHPSPLPKGEGTEGNVVLTMLPGDMPATSRPVKAMATPYEEQKQLARKLLEKLWAAAEKNQKPSKEKPIEQSSETVMERKVAGKVVYEVVPPVEEKPDIRRQIQGLMARLDPQQAEKWAKELGSPAPEEASNSIENVAEADLEEALSLLTEKEENAYESLQRLARHFADSDKEKALRCAEEAIVRVRSLDQPDRAVELARMGELVAELGNKEAGKKLSGQAADMAAKWPASGRFQYVLERLIRSIAACDTARAEGLLEKVADEEDREKLRMEIAITAGDVEKLESLLKEQDADAARQARRRLALQIAETRPTEAVRVAERIPEDKDQNECEVLVEVATAVAPHDAALARALIARIVAKYYQSLGKPVGSDGDRALEMAKLAVLAQKVGYPDVEGMVYRVLALRPTVGESENPESVRSAAIDIAKILALVDPETAKQILERNPSKSSPWHTAMALADPQRAMEEADRMLASAKDPEAKIGVPTFLFSLAELWATPPDERLEYLSPHYPDYNGVRFPAAVFSP
ncbi:MAG: carboxypeptidase regulatory-like domain-containing protein [Pirellulales bacterium]|nr:carboxypeptidase regulatory-like domain-containing protein [Pirellulales bacterium]